MFSERLGPLQEGSQYDLIFTIQIKGTVPVRNNFNYQYRKNMFYKNMLILNATFWPPPYEVSPHLGSTVGEMATAFELKRLQI
jgi:hypothetical protein